MLKRTICFLMCVCMLLCSIPGAAAAETAAVKDGAVSTLSLSGSYGDNISWELDGGVLQITGSGDMPNPRHMPSWLDYNNSIRTVIIGEGITSIDTYAFYKCQNLTSVSIPGTVTRIDYNAFQACSSLPGIVIPDSVVSLGSAAFSDCTALESVYLSKNLTSIENYTFQLCKSLKTVNIPEGVTSIGKKAFAGCAMTEIALPSTLTSIGDEAFTRSDLVSLTIPSGVTSIGSNAFAYCYSLTDARVECTESDLAYAFFYCMALANVTLPEGLHEIGDYAFSYCSSLTDITIPSGVTSIGEYAFANCTSLTSITIPASVTSIGKYAFRSCTGLTHVYYGGSREQWEAMTVGVQNTYLTNATISYTEPVLLITKQPTDQSVKANDTAKFTVEAAGSDLKYQWQYRTSESGSWKDSGAASATTAAFSVKATTARNGYQYRCKITDAAGEVVYSDAATLTVTGVTITTQPKTQNVKADATAKFTVKATGNGLKYQWQYRTSSSGSWKNSGATSATTATFSVKGTTARNGYQYRCKVTDSSGNSVYTNTVTLYVLGITTQPKTTTVANNATAKFTVKATGNALKYQWQYRTSSSGSWKNSGAASATTATFSVKGTTARNGYQYRCKITDSAGNTVYSSTVTLKVSAASITTQPKNVTVADGKTAKFTVKTSGSNLSYQWQYRTSSTGSWKDSGAASATTTSFSVKGTAARNGYQYRCKITDSNGTVVYTNTVTLTVN